MRLNIGIDLGSDSLKIAFAYTGGKIHHKKSSFQYGKFESENDNIRVAMPALAYYDDDKSAWIFGDDVEKKSASSFVKVVKLKSLLSLLIPKSEDAITASNKELYEKGHHFPKFFFPTRRGMDEKFQEAIDEGRTFEVTNYTPKKVLEEFFKTFVLNVVKTNVKKLAELHEIDVSMNDIRTTVVFPPMVGDVYVNELCRLVQIAFGKEPYKALSSVKALALYAFRRHMIDEGEEALLFDMGEENISVAKAFMNGKQVLIEGAEGHNEPLAIGGVDVDDAIASYVETSISHRVTLGQITPEGEEEKPPEKPIVGKQYLFMKNIKKAKVVLSRPDYEDSTFHEGVPIGLHCELYIQRFLSRTEFDNCLGISERIVAEALAKKVRKGAATIASASAEESAPEQTPAPQQQSGGGKKGKKKKLGGLRGSSEESASAEVVTEAPAPEPVVETPASSETGGSGRRLGGLRSRGSAPVEEPSPEAPAPEESSGGRRFGGFRSSSSSSEAPAPETPAPSESSSGSGRRFGGFRSSSSSSEAPAPETPAPSESTGGSGRRLGGLRSSGSAPAETPAPQEETRFKGFRRSKLAVATPELDIDPETMEVVSSVSEGEVEITPEYVPVPIDEENSIAHRVLAYIQEELSRPTNENMTSRSPAEGTLERRGFVILSGGLVETHALLEYLKYHLQKSHPHIDVLTFDDDMEQGDIFTILSHEDSAYAPAIGGAIVAMEDYDVKTALSLSYATWGCPVGGANSRKNIVHLTLLAERGAALTDSGSEFSTDFIMASTIEGEAIFSCIISQEDIDSGRLEQNGSTYMHGGMKKLIIGRPGSKERQNVERLIHLQTVAGGENGKLMLMYQGKEVQVVGDQQENYFRIRQGIRATKEGRVHPFYEVIGAMQNGRQSNSLTVRFDNGATAQAPVSAVTVQSNIRDFDSSSG